MATATTYSIASYDVGDLIPLTFTFRNPAGTLTNPTTVTLSIRDPAGTTTTPTPVNASTGVYTHDLTPNLPGLWEYRIVGTGAVAEAGEGALWARSTLF